MSRNYVIQEWQDAAAFTGEMIKNRQSKGNHFVGNSANTALYADEEPKAKAKPKRSIRYKIIPQQTRLDNIEQMMRDLDAEYTEGGMSAREYAELSLVLEKKHDRAYQLLAKAMGWQDELSQEEAIEEHHPAKANLWTESRTTASKKDSIFLSLPVDNVFYRLYIAVTQAKKALNSLKGK